MRGRRVQDDIERLYRERLPHFERCARAITGDRESALDAVQEGFADALRAARTFERRGPLEAWLWRCVVNRARKARSAPRVDAAPADVSVTNGHAAEDEASIRARIALLPERQRLAIFLRYYADLDYRSIAHVLEIEVGTVSATLSHAHAALRTTLTEGLR